jgi:hypothetical protein
MSETPSFWDEIEAYVAALDGTEPDPWAEADVGAAALTDEQVAFLEGLADQPPLPRLHDSSPPGD